MRATTSSPDGNGHDGRNDRNTDRNDHIDIDNWNREDLEKFAAELRSGIGRHQRLLALVERRLGRKPDEVTRQRHRRNIRRGGGIGVLVLLAAWCARHPVPALSAALTAVAAGAALMIVGPGGIVPPGHDDAEADRPAPTRAAPRRTPPSASPAPTVTVTVTGTPSPSPSASSTAIPTVTPTGVPTALPTATAAAPAPTASSDQVGTAATPAPTGASAQPPDDSAGGTDRQPSGSDGQPDSGDSGGQQPARPPATGGGQPGGIASHCLVRLDLSVVNVCL